MDIFEYIYESKKDPMPTPCLTVPVSGDRVRMQIKQKYGRAYSEVVAGQEGIVVSEGLASDSVLVEFGTRHLFCAFCDLEHA